MARKKSRKRRRRGRLIIFLVLAAALGAAGYYFLGSSHQAPEGPQLVLYFFRGDGALKPVMRPLETSPDPAQAIRALIAGPSPEEISAGYSTQIPTGVRLLSFKASNMTAEVNLSRELASYGGGAARVQGLLAQIVYTATEFRGIAKVKLLVNGSSDVVLGGEGLVVDKPMGRGDIKL